MRSPVASVFDSWAAMPELVSAEPLAEAGYVWQWLVFRPAAVTYDEVRRLNDYGLRVHSAHVLQHPPTTAQLPAELQPYATSTDQDLRALVAVGGVMLFLVTTLRAIRLKPADRERMAKLPLNDSSTDH